jgi:hypothetical protein
MIKLSELKESDIGRDVIYYDGFEEERGRIKSWNGIYIFVVYHCDGKWDDYQNYTASLLLSIARVLMLL